MEAPTSFNKVPVKALNRAGCQKSKTPEVGPAGVIFSLFPYWEETIATHVSVRAPENFADPLWQT